MDEDDSYDDSSVEEEDSQTINKGGVFSSTQNDAAEVMPEKSSAAKKKKKNRSTPKRRRNASRFPPYDLGPLDSNINKISRVGVAAKAAPEKDAAPSRDNAAEKRRAAPPVPTAAPLPNAQPDFASFIRAMELDQTRRNVEKVRPKTVFTQYNPKYKNEYNHNMAQFDKAFGKRDGITGSEKLTELAGHWFGGEAPKQPTATSTVIMHTPPSENIWIAFTAKTTTQPLTPSPSLKKEAPSRKIVSSHIKIST